MIAIVFVFTFLFYLAKYFQLTHSHTNSFTCTSVTDWFVLCSSSWVSLSSHTQVQRIVIIRTSFLLKFSFPSSRERDSSFVKASRRLCSSCCSRSGLETFPVLCNQSPSSAGSPESLCIRRRSVVAWGLCPSSSTWCCRALCGSVLACRVCAHHEPDEKGIPDKSYDFKAQADKWKILRV